MVAQCDERHCLYCGSPTKRGRRGEHLIPEAIGGALTLNDVSDRVVCARCNNGVLSQLDKELCSRSYLSAVASQQIDAHLWQAWDVDHEAKNLLVEDRPLWMTDGALHSLVCFPQVVSDRKGPHARGDFEECCEFGREDYSPVLFQAVRHCFGRYRSGEKGALHFERVRSDIERGGYRLPPRIFTRASISAVAQNIRKQSFVLRFGSEEDMGLVLDSLPNLGNSRQLNKWAIMLGTYSPTISFFFDVGETMRALMKLGLNLIAAFCPNTPVNHRSFADPIEVIRGEVQIPARVVSANGFVHAEDIHAISAPGNAHSFRLAHVDDQWHVFSSFFGGRIGTHIRVPGPNHEEWKSADIVAPLRSKNSEVSTSPILPFMKNPRVAWRNASVITPSFKLRNSESSLVVGRVKKKKS